MKPWKLSYGLRLTAVLCVLAAATAQANPDDPLEQLLRQRQQTQQQDAPDGLENLIRSKIAESAKPKADTAVSHKAAAAPIVRAVGRATGTVSRGDADALLSNAMGLLGVAYRFGGTSPKSGFDCSGFMQHIFRKAFAVNLPRTSAQQAQVGSYVSRSGLQPGDMVFFRTSGRRISHVGMYVGNDRFIHSPRTGKRVEITSLSNKYWSARYATARRVKRHNAGNFIR